MGELEKSCILTGGDPFGTGPPVVPGTLSVLQKQVSIDIPTALEGRRTQLANWITDFIQPTYPKGHCQPHLALAFRGTAGRKSEQFLVRPVVDRHTRSYWTTWLRRSLTVAGHSSHCIVVLCSRMPIAAVVRTQTQGRFPNSIHWGSHLLCFDRGD